MIDFKRKRSYSDNGGERTDRNAEHGHPARSHATFGLTAAGVAAGVGVAGLGLTAYGMAHQGQQSNSAAPARNFGNELGQIGGLIPNFNQQGYQNQVNYNGAITGLNQNTFNNAMRGNFDLAAYEAQNPGFTQQFNDYQRQGELAGWTPEQYALANSGNDQSRLTYSGGFGQQARSAFNSANHGLVNYTNGLQGTMDRLNGQAPGNVNASGYFATGAGNTAVPNAAGAQNTQAQSFGGNDQQYGGGGFNALPAPNQARNVNAQNVGTNFGYDRVQPNTGYSLVNPNTSFNAVQARQGDTGLTSALGRLNNTAPSQIQQTLTQQAQQGLALGSSLSSTETRDAQQAAREGWGARGLINSNGAVAQEVLNQHDLGQQRLQQRQQFAQGVDATNFGQAQQGFTNALGVSNAAQNYAGLNLQAQQANLGARLQGNAQNLQGQLANQNAGLQSNVLGFQGQVANQGARQASNAQSLQGQIANQGANLAAQQANQGADLTLNNQRFQTGSANLQAQLTNNQLGLGYSQLNNQAFQSAQDRLQQGSQFNAASANNTAQFNAGALNNMNQFGANLAQQNNQYNAGATNTAAQFNASATNNLGMFNANLQATNANDQWARAMGLGQFQGQQAINPLQYYGLINGQAPDYTNALLGYGQDLYNTNYNGQAAANISGNNNAAALTGAGLGLVGNAANLYGNYAGNNLFGYGTGQGAQGSGPSNGGYVRIGPFASNPTG